MVTDKQIAALKYLIFHSKQGKPLSKQILAFLLDGSKNLTREVYVTLWPISEYTPKEVRDSAIGIDAMKSPNGSTHLNEVMDAMGTEFGFDIHYGHFHEGDFITAGQFPGLPSRECHPFGLPARYTFWCSPHRYSDTAEPLLVTRAELEAIDLKKPGLYPTLE
ncbi:MAG: hypothetical protein HZC02_05070 [Candidatus Levybacteria bacterium]|nr:hypothetical protein [Candidatus Levybacteria bacterium]